MAVKILNRRVRILVAVFLAGVFYHPAQAAERERPHALDFLNALYNESAKSNSWLKLQSSRLESKRLAVATESAKNLPTIGLDVSSGPTRVWPYNETEVDSGAAKTSWNTESQIALRQNIYAGGRIADSREVAEIEYQIQSLALVAARQSLWASLANELLEITRLNLLLQEKTALLQNALELQKIAERKSQSGFLGRKALLESERETFRSEHEKQNALSSLETALTIFNVKHQLKEHAIESNKLARLQTLLHAAATKGLEQLESSEYSQGVASANLELQQKILAEKSSVAALRGARSQRFAPNLDLVAGVSATHQNNIQSNEEPAQLVKTPSGTLRAFASLNFTMRLLDPVASSQSEASREVLTASKLDTQQARFNLTTFVQETTTRKISLKKSIESQRKLVTLSEDLRLKNNRLFEAGEIDVLEVISSQKELSFQRQSLIELETQLFSLGLKAVFATQMGFTQQNQAESAAP